MAMKSALSDARWSGAGWALALAATLALLVAAVLPPFVGPALDGALHAGFSLVCHQLPERSFAVGGVSFAVCHRCTGIFAGLVLGALALPALRGRVDLSTGERWWVLAAVLPAALDWGGDVLGLWTNTAGTRVATGLWFGVVAGVLFARALAVRPARPRSARSE